MKKFVGLNIMAFFYGFALFAETELMVNCYRLERIMHWFNFTAQKISVVILFVAFTIFFCIMTKRHFSAGKLRYILAVLWIPYYAVLTFLFSFLFPAVNRGDNPPPVLGIVLFGIWLVYPFYIATVNFICTKNRIWLSKYL